MRRGFRKMALAMSLVLGLTGVAPATVNAGSGQSMTLAIRTAEGEEKEIDFVNPKFRFEGSSTVSGDDTVSGNEVQYRESISLFTEGNRPYVNDNSIKTNVAVVVDNSLTVTQVINASVNGAKPSFSEATDVEVPDGGFVLLACDSSYYSAGYKLFLATKFKVGDRVCLIMNGEEATLDQVLEKCNNLPTEEPSEIKYSLEGLMLETAFDPDFESAGKQKEIDFVNPDFTGRVTFKNSISLFTHGNRPYVSDGAIKTNVAVVVDKDMTVVRVINQSVNGAKPAFNEATDVDAPEGGFVLLACDDSYANAGYKKFLATEFKAGDKIKLVLQGQEITLVDVLRLTGQDRQDDRKQPSLKLDTAKYATVKDAEYTVMGKIGTVTDFQNCSVRIRNAGTGAETTCAVDGEGAFAVGITLGEGTNYIEANAVYNGKNIDETVQKLVVYKAVQQEAKPVLMWVDQFSSAKNLNSVEKIQRMVAKAKEAGVTGFLFDCKGCEGYASYKKTPYSNTPYMTETTNRNKAVSMEIDFLEEMIKAAHENGIKLYASLNFFTEGNLQMRDSAIDIFNNHSDWAEVLQTPEDKGELKSVLDSAKNSTLVYVNPGNREVRDRQLSMVREILENYNVDGIIVDRGRYDNQYADFSDLSREQFAAYLQEKGKTLENWPADAFTIQADGSMVKGRYYLDWITYRSTVIKSFVGELREVVNSYEAIQNRNIDLATYVGAWYETLYQNGINWASKSFRYNDCLEFPVEQLYTDEAGYADSGYLEYLDFIMTGCYYPTEELMNKYTTLSNVLVNGEIPVLASIDLSNLNSAALQRQILQNAYRNTDGAMIFDLALVNWSKIACALADTEWVNDMVIGAYNKTTGERVAVDAVDVAREEDALHLYTEAYGESTGTNQWGVEAAVDASGRVVEMRNQKQAAEWNWGTPDLNNTTIPAGGFVLSAMDHSGSRVYRQMLANSFHLGDEVYAASLSGYPEYENKIYTEGTADISIVAKVYNASAKISVYANETQAQLVEGDTYNVKVGLTDGENEICLSVWADDAMVLAKSIFLTGKGQTVIEPPTEDNGQKENNAPATSATDTQAEEKMFVLPYERGSVDWNAVSADIQAAADAKGMTKNVDIKTDGLVEVPAPICSEVKNAGVVLALHPGDGIAFSVSAEDVTKTVCENGLRLQLMKESTIPLALIQKYGANSATGRVLSVNGAEFGMRLGMHLSLGSSNAGKNANLYRYNAEKNDLEYIGTFIVTKKGQAMFELQRGGEFFITVTDTAPAETMVPGRTYLVTRGDTLSAIAKRNHVALKRLLEANPWISRPDRIYAGQQILIPEK